jgi:HlyD family secretion protein
MTSKFISIIAAVWLACLAACGESGDAASGQSAASSPAGASSAVKPSLSVQVIQPRLDDWAMTLSAHGPVAAWQESIIGAEVSGLRLTQVLVNVGDVVRKGQPLATMRQESVQAEVSAARAALQEAQAAAQDAKANAERARKLRQSEFLSAQETGRLLTAEQAALARVTSLQAQLSASELRLAQTRVVAPEDGVISARQAVAGMMAQPGQELFRLIVQSRLEWRAQVPAADLSKLKAGVVTSLSAPGTLSVQGRVRSVSPSVDGTTRQGTVYVDMPLTESAGAGLRAGMFASGSFDLARTRAMTVPQSAVLLRDGFSLVFEVEGSKVRQRKVELGRRLGERVEIVQGVGAEAQLVASGVGFLTDGDTVRVVAGKPAEDRP